MLEMEDESGRRVLPQPVVAKRRGRRSSTGAIEPVALVVALVMLVMAALFQFVIRPVTSPGFTYLAACLALGGIGALIAAGLKV